MPMIHSGVSVYKIQRTVLASNTDSVFRQFVWYLYLPLGSMGPYFDFVNILPEEKVCSQALGLRSLKLQASSEPVDVLASKERFACFPLGAQKAVWHSRNLKFFCVLSLIIHCQLEFLEEATMDFISKAVIS